MDQIRTGKFIRRLRTERGWTQSAFAGRLGVSEKTVSKWETGRGLPEVSLMLPVCELLGITVNELLAGERLEGEAYRERAEERLLLTCDRTRPETKVVICNAACWVSVAVWLTLIFIAAFCDLPVWARITMIVCAILGMSSRPSWWSPSIRRSTPARSAKPNLCPRSPPSCSRCTPQKSAA